MKTADSFWKTADKAVSRKTADKRKKTADITKTADIVSSFCLFVIFVYIQKLRNNGDKF